MNAQEQLIEEFYAGFAASEADTMISCYHPDIVFTDPAFGTLEGVDVADMWRMLLQNAQDYITIEFSDIKATDLRGSANCIAEYKFANRPVRNCISSKFEFKDGLIIKQVDTYDIWKWSQQALGLRGLLFGWSSFMKNKIQQQAISSLRKFQRKKK